MNHIIVLGKDNLSPQGLDCLPASGLPSEEIRPPVFFEFSPGERKDGPDGGRRRFPLKNSTRKALPTPPSLSAPRPFPLKGGRIRIFIGKSERKSFCEGPGPPLPPRRTESLETLILSGHFLDSRSPTGFHFFPTIEEWASDVKPTGTFFSHPVASVAEVACSCSRMMGRV